MANRRLKTRSCSADRPRSLPLFALLVAFFAAGDAHAYLDPATGGMFLTASVGAVTAVFYFLRSLYYALFSVPAWFSGRKDRTRERRGIVFYSEGPQYWNTFAPVLRELDARGVPCTYLTSSEKDPGLHSGLQTVEARFIGEGPRAYFTLNSLLADVVVMTTPGLDVLQIRRSKGVKHYVHVTHSAGGCSGYVAFSMDYFDSVFVGGEGDLGLIRELERKRGLSAKRVDIVGCTYLDVLAERLAGLPALPASTGRRTVLVSPTWGPRGLLAIHGRKLLAALLADGRYRVLVRPHPQSAKVETELLADLQTQFPAAENLEWDFSVDGLASMRRADLMISDWSGIVFDYLFLLGRPVLTFQGEYFRSGREAMFLDGDPWGVRTLNRIRASLTADDVPRIGEILSACLDDRARVEGVLSQARLDMYQNAGRAGAVAAERLIEIQAALPVK